ncbi:anti-sigma factor [Microbacterium sp. Root166]|uniref:anti-sigma factor n=1 Tax=Microbacterium sp. Root166 TaxID=1736478 RepID=UPI0006F6077C|nr:anti-sigma factor [Microbacterium sp. Root166]KQZ83472.1 anti-sigma factor [Microbacterium sp. Root166]
MNEQEFAELAAGEALNALSPEDRRLFQAARAAHPEWEHWVDADSRAAAVLADAVAEVAPPLTLRSTLLSRIAVMPQLPDTDAAEAAAAHTAAVTDAAPAASAPPAADEPVRDVATDPAPTTATIQAITRRNWTRGLLTLAASMVLLVALGYGTVAINEYLNRPAAVVALQEIESAPDAQSATAEITDGGTATAHWSESVGKAVLVSDGLPEIAEDQSFELWFVRDGAAISAGVFDPADEAAATAQLDGTMEPGDVIAVTIEPQGGSPDGTPSSDPIVAIPTA